MEQIVVVRLHQYNLRDDALLFLDISTKKISIKKITIR